MKLVADTKRLRELAMTRQHSPFDYVLASADVALRTLFANPRAARMTPQPVASAIELTATEKRHAAGLMRVNHVGEVCAQALYSSQGLMAKTKAQREQFEQAAREETDHLAWTAHRLTELDSRTSIFNPLWYAAAFALGVVAGKIGERVSLGFVVETETQVEAHLASHLQKDGTGLPTNDVASRAIVQQMQIDEAEHGAAAKAAGADELPQHIKCLMAKSARMMTRTAYWV